MVLPNGSSQMLNTATVTEVTDRYRVNANVRMPFPNASQQ